MKLIKTLLAGLLVIGSTTVFAQSTNIDVKKSTIKWVGEKVSGMHEGTIMFKSGQVTMAGDKITAGVFVVDMTSITCTDLEDAEWNGKLIGHLKSDDFFGVEKFPTSKLVITKGGKISDSATELTANLTIKGVTHPVVIKAKKEGDKLLADVTVDRTLYNIRYGSGKFFDNLGDKMIKDNFVLIISVIL